METVKLHEEEEEESSAIAALGSMFKLTEVYLSDKSQEGKLLLESENTDVDLNNTSPLNEFGSLPEDLELARQMNEMGLPISFHTNKEQKKNRTLKGKIKDGKKKNLSSCKNTPDEALTSIQELKGEECESNGILHGNSNKASSCMSLLGQSESSSSCTGNGDIHCLNGGEEGLNNLSDGNAHASLGCIACNQQSDLSLDNAKDNISTCEKVQLEKDVGVMFGSSLECGSHAESCPINSNVDSRCISGEALNGHCEGNPLNGEQMEYACVECPLTEEQVESMAMQMAEHYTENGLLCSNVGEELNSCNRTNDNCEGTINDWRLYWDNDYQRNYFYNIVTMRCTWDPPPGMDDLVFTNFTTKQPETALEMELDIADLNESNDLQTSASLPSDLDIADGFIEDDVLLDKQLNESEGTGEVADNLCTLSSTKQKKRVRKKKFKWKLPTEAQELEVCNIIEEISPSLNKYWRQRYLLFNKYDDGIKMDEEGWFSVTPEAIAKHHALRCGSGTIVDFFTGVGGNSIQFAKRSKHVIAIDIDPKRIDLAQYNAAIYGVGDQIDFIRGDSFVLAPYLKADVVFMSPPWGGPDYLKERTFDMKTMLRPHDGNFLFSIGRGIASKVVMFLPRNVDISELAELSLSVNPPWSLEVEKNYLNGRLKAITAYFCKPS